MGRNVLWNDVFWVDCQPSSIRGRRWRRKSLGKTEKCGDDEEERKKEAKSLLHVRMCTSLLFLCTVLLLVLCFFTYVWFCVGVTFCFMFCVFLCHVQHSYFLTFFFHVAFVCTTPGSNSLLKHHLRLVLSHTGAEELYCRQIQTAPEWNQLKSKRSDLMQQTVPL